MAKTNIISVDLGGTKILTSVLDKKNEILTRVKVPTKTSEGPDYIVDCIAESVNKAIKLSKIDKNSVKAIALGVPGIVNPKSGMVFNAPNLYVKNYNIKKSLEKRVKLDVVIENDVNLAALGIKRFEYKNNVKNMLVIFVGTGIGGAIIFDNKMYRGSSFFAGEIGHMKIEKDSEGNPISFENLASRTAIVRQITSEIKMGKKSVLTDYVEEGKKIKSKNLAKAVAKNDEIVVKHIKNACGVIGRELANMTTFLNFDTIVLGGGVVEAMEDFMLPKIKASFDENVLSEPGKMVEIKATKLGDDAALYGGPELADEFL